MTPRRIRELELENHRLLKENEELKQRLAMAERPQSDPAPAKRTASRKK